MILRFYFFGEFDIIKTVKGLVLDFNKFSMFFIIIKDNIIWK